MSKVDASKAFSAFTTNRTVNMVSMHAMMSSPQMLRTQVNFLLRANTKKTTTSVTLSAIAFIYW